MTLPCQPSRQKSTEYGQSSTRHEDGWIERPGDVARTVCYRHPWEPVFSPVLTKHTMPSETAVEPPRSCSRPLGRAGCKLNFQFRQARPDRGNGLVSSGSSRSGKRDRECGPSCPCEQRSVTYLSGAAAVPTATRRRRPVLCCVAALSRLPARTRTRGATATYVASASFDRLELLSLARRGSFLCRMQRSMTVCGANLA